MGRTEGESISPAEENDLEEVKFVDNSLTEEGWRSLIKKKSSKEFKTPPPPPPLPNQILFHCTGLSQRRVKKYVQDLFKFAVLIPNAHKVHLANQLRHRWDSLKFTLLLSPASKGCLARQWVPFR